MVLWIPLSYLTVSPTRLSLPSVGFPTPFGYSSIYYIAVRNPQGISTSGLASFAFARHYSQNLGWFLFLCLLRCFSSAGSLDVPILFSTPFTVLHREGFPIRKSADRSLFAAPRSLSQLVTSFFGFRCQGIRPVLFFAWTFPFMVLVLLLYSILLNCIWVSIINCFGSYTCEKVFPFFVLSFSPPQWWNCS